MKKAIIKTDYLVSNSSELTSVESIYNRFNEIYGDDRFLAENDLIDTDSRRTILPLIFSNRVEFLLSDICNAFSREFSVALKQEGKTKYCYCEIVTELKNSDNTKFIFDLHSYMSGTLCSESSISDISFAVLTTMVNNEMKCLYLGSEDKKELYKTLDGLTCKYLQLLFNIFAILQYEAKTIYYLAGSLDPKLAEKELFKEYNEFMYLNPYLLTEELGKNE